VTAPRRRRSLLAALVAVAAVALPAAGCGQEEHRTHAESEGIYLDVGELQYQVQVSRQHNPRDTEDRGYFVGVPDAQRLGPGETWFAVFVKVWNRSGERQLSAGRFEVEDTTGKRYEPVEVGEDNVFAYRPAEIPANGTLPPTDSVANEGAIGGSMLLYRITLASLANRPLEFHIVSPRGEATVALDV